MNLRRLHQWFALPDAVRSPWKRRLVRGAPFVVVIVCVFAWRGARPTLGADVKLVDVSREEAAVLAGMVDGMIKQSAVDSLLNGKLRVARDTIRMERVIAVMLHSNQHAEVRTTFAPDWNRAYHFKRDGKGWSGLLDIEELIAP